jgi:hypothetical protein
MLPAYDHQAIVKAAVRAGFTPAVLAEICRVPVANVEAIFAGRAEGFELMDLLRVGGTLRLTMLQMFPWAKPQGPPGQVDFEILTRNRGRRWFRVVEACPASDGGRAEETSGVCAAAAASV